MNLEQVKTIAKQHMSDGDYSRFEGALDSALGIVRLDEAEWWSARTSMWQRECRERLTDLRSSRDKTEETITLTPEELQRCIFTFGSGVLNFATTLDRINNVLRKKSRIDPNSLLLGRFRVSGVFDYAEGPRRIYMDLSDIQLESKEK